MLLQPTSRLTIGFANDNVGMLFVCKLGAKPSQAKEQKSKVPIGTTWMSQVQPKLRLPPSPLTILSLERKKLKII